MRPLRQEHFFIAVKDYLCRQPKGLRTVTSLAQRLGFNRSTVSTAINTKRHPRVRAEILKLLP